MAPLQFFAAFGCAFIGVFLLVLVARIVSEVQHRAHMARKQRLFDRWKSAKNWGDADKAARLEAEFRRRYVPTTKSPFEQAFLAAWND